MKMGIRLGLVAGLAMLCGAANAATTTANFQVRLTLTTSCTINSATDLDFGSSGVITGNIDQTSTINVQRARSNTSSSSSRLIVICLAADYFPVVIAIGNPSGADSLGK